MYCGDYKNVSPPRGYKTFFINLLMAVMSIVVAFTFFDDSQNSFTLLRHGVEIDSLVTEEYGCSSATSVKNNHVCVKYKFELENQEGVGFKWYSGEADLWGTKLGDNPPGSKLKVFYYPNNPNVSGIIPDDEQNMARYYVGMAFAFILFLIGLLLGGVAIKDFKIGKEKASKIFVKKF